MKRQQRSAKKPLHNRALRGVKLALLPHAHNDYRPHLIRRYGLALILLFVLATQSFYFIFQNGQILGDQAAVTATRLLNETNEQRAENSLPALSLNAQLSDAAANKAKNMLSVGYWAHNAPDGTPPWRWIKDAGYTYVDAGENLARGFNSTEAIMRAWMASPEHRANVLDAKYTEVGFAAMNGVMDGKSTTLVVAMYGRPIGVPNTSGVTTETRSAATENVTFWSRLRRGAQSLAPSLLVVLIIVGIATCVAILAHTYRRRLPKHLRESWYRHHALYKLVFLLVLAISAILSYGGGMI